MTVYLQVINDQGIVREVELVRPIEVGRCYPQESMADEGPRLLIAEAQQTSVPRQWFQVSQVAAGEVQIRNLHRAHAVFMEDLAGPIPPGQSRQLLANPPVTIRLLEGARLRICDQDHRQLEPLSGSDDMSGIRSLLSSGSNEAKGNSGGKREDSPMLTMRPFAEGRVVEGADALALVRKALSVVEAAASSDGFLEAAVRAAVEIVGLDRAAILIPNPNSAAKQTSGQQPNAAQQSSASSAAPASAAGTSPAGMPVDSQSISISIMAASLPADCAPRNTGAAAAAGGKPKSQWRSRAQYLANHARDGQLPRVSSSVLRRVMELAQTQIYEANLDMMSMSLDSVSSVVAAPILDRDKSVAAVLYGDRWLAVEGADTRISELEALLLEVLAGAVAGGIARQQEERSRANLSEFFSPRVASMLVARPDLLSGRDADVSVLFCDVRGFSAISEQFGPELTIEWINDVLTELSQCVVDGDGVLVDYVGDELLAMWGAPEEQPDHAERALTAARQMLVAIERLRTRWDSQFGATLDVGIGINSGPARVGNVGSRLKFKYGVLGHTVNLGSRLQGACKHLGVRCIASADSVAAAGNRDCARRLARLRVAGIRETIAVYECVASVTSDWKRLCEEYEAALLDFEGGQPGESVHRLGRLLQEFPGDRPSAFLLGRAAKSLTDPTSQVDAIWELPGK
ncbi:adenylate/guanylate cyclase domain-containing protein [Planctomycetaceae bacterium SH139]